MRIVTCPKVRVYPSQLRDELLSRSVPLAPDPAPLPLDDVRIDATTLYVAVDVDRDDAAYDAVVRQVVAAHVPPLEKTPAQIKQANAEKGFAADDPLAILVRALVLVVTDLQNENAARVAARQPLRTLTPKQIHAAIRNKFGSLTE